MSSLKQKKLKNDQERFKNIYEMFMKGAYLTTKELSEQEGVSQRVIQKDIKSLVENGILKKDGHRYYMPKEFRNQEILAEAEMSTSMMSALFAKAFPKIDTSHLFQKYPKNTKCFFFDFVLEEIKDEEIVANIVFAISHKVALNFIYTNKSAITSNKTAYPLKISNFSGDWYLIAYDLQKDKINTYHLNSISELKVLEDDYLDAKRETLEQEAKQIHSVWYSNDPKTVKLKVTGIAIEYIKRKKYPHVTIEQADKNSMYITMRYYNAIEVIQFVKEWLPFVSIEANDKLNAELKKILQEALGNL